MRHNRKFRSGTAELVDGDEPIGLDLLRAALGPLAEIKTPKEAEEPVLATKVRVSVFEWLFEIRAAEDLKAVNVKPRRSCLLYGPPGCGKTTLAHHLAARLGLPLVVMNLAGILGGGTLGSGGKNLHNFFGAIKAYEEPVVVLLDELDTIGAKRLQADQAAAKEQNADLNHLLVMVEKFEHMLLGATNRQDDLDPALWRRFGMQLSVDLPGPDEVFAILKRYSLPYEIDHAVLDVLAHLTQGASPSLLRQLMEGLKRALVLSPRMKRPIDSLPFMLEQIVAAVAPPPEMTAPPLWRNVKQAERLKGMPWPPALPGKGA